ESRLHVPHPPIDPDVRGFRSARSCGKRRGAETTLAGWPVTRHHGDARGSAMRSGRAPTLRIRRPHWRDPRLGIGVVLVALAVAAGAWTFAQADRTEPVYEARETITAGESLDEETLVLTRVRLAGLEERYLTPDALEPGSIA